MIKRICKEVSRDYRNTHHPIIDCVFQRWSDEGGIEDGASSDLSWRRGFHAIQPGIDPVHSTKLDMVQELLVGGVAAFGATWQRVGVIRWGWYVLWQYHIVLHHG